MDIYNRLKQEHDRQRELAAQLLQTEGKGGDRPSLWAVFKTEAVAHANAEEQTFYAELIEKPKAQEKARHSISEHKEAADLIEKLEEMDMGTGAWLTKFKSLHEELEHHMKEEESEVFELARSVLDRQLETELTSRYDERKCAES
jgi:hypothetical protein